MQELLNRYGFTCVKLQKLCDRVRKNVVSLGCFPITNKLKNYACIWLISICIIS